MKAKTSRRRRVTRDDFIGFRCPRELKSKLENLSERRTRDLSSWAIEFLQQGLDRVEQEERVAQRARELQLLSQHMSLQHQFSGASVAP